MRKKNPNDRPLVPLRDGVPAVLAAIRACGPSGAYLKDIAPRLDMSARRLRAILHLIREEDLCPYTGGLTHPKYYAERDWADANPPRSAMTDAERKRYWREKKRARDGYAGRSYTRREQANDAPVAVKSPRIEVDGPVIVPPDVKITRAPTPRPRFAPEDGYTGAFIAEWNDRRAHGQEVR